jgi:hypothetical protein
LRCEVKFRVRITKNESGRENESGARY